METRICKECKNEKNLKTDFYEIPIKKKIYYRRYCKPCYCLLNGKYRDKDLIYFENDFDELPYDVKLRVLLLCLENHSLKYIAQQVKCKYNTLWFGIKSKQIENFAVQYVRENPNNKYNIAIKE